MNKRLLWIVAGVLFCASAVAALDSDGRPQLKLVPAPKEVQLRDGGFQVGPRTKIFVQLGHQSEDRIAAETLAEEVADQTGLKTRHPWHEGGGEGRGRRDRAGPVAGLEGAAVSGAEWTQGRHGWAKTDICCSPIDRT